MVLRFFFLIQDWALYAGMVVFVCVSGHSDEYIAGLAPDCVVLSAVITIPMLCSSERAYLFAFPGWERHFTNPCCRSDCLSWACGLSGLVGAPLDFQTIGLRFVVLSHCFLPEVRFAAGGRPQERMISGMPSAIRQ